MPDDAAVFVSKRTQPFSHKGQSHRKRYFLQFSSASKTCRVWSRLLVVGSMGSNAIWQRVWFFKAIFWSAPRSTLYHAFVFTKRCIFDQLRLFGPGRMAQELLSLFWCRHTWKFSIHGEGEQYQRKSWSLRFHVWRTLLWECDGGWKLSRIFFNGLREFKRHLVFKRFEWMHKLFRVR